MCILFLAKKTLNDSKVFLYKGKLRKERKIFTSLDDAALKKAIKFQHDNYLLCARAKLTL